MVDSEPDHQQFSTSRRKHIKSLLRSCPELVPVGSFIPELCYISEAVSDITTWHNPMVSELLAFGVAGGYQKGASTEHGSRVIALVEGFGRESVQVACLNSQRCKWEGSKEIQFDTLKISDEDCSWWMGSKGPVQQVCFSEKDDHFSNWLAIRTLQCISIVSLTFSETPTIRSSESIRVHGNRNHRLTSLSIDKIIDISLAETGRVLVYVAFNPWNEQHIAAIDTKGHFTLWSIIRKEGTRDVWTAKSGHIVNVFDGQDSSDNKESDGWGKIMWAGDANNMVAATRKVFSVYAIESPMRRLKCPTLLEEKRQGWILDMQRSPDNSSHVFVLTSHRIFCLNLLSAREREATEEGDVGTKILVSCIHHREPKDISLRLSLSAGNDSESREKRSCSSGQHPGVLVMLYSIITGHTTCHEFLVPAHTDLYHSFSKPLPLRSNTIGDWVGVQGRDKARVPRDGKFSRPLCIALEAVPLFRNNHGEREPSRSDPLEAKVDIHQIYQLCHDSKVVTSLCILSKDTNVLESGNLIVAGLERSKSKKSLKASPLDDFIIPDEMMIGEDGRQVRDKLDHRVGEMRFADQETWTISRNWLTDIISELVSVAPGESRSVASSEEMIVWLLENLQTKITGIHTLYVSSLIASFLANVLRINLLPRELPIEEIDEASASLQSLLDQVDDLALKGELDNGFDDDHAGHTLRTVSTVTPNLAQLLQKGKPEKSDVALVPIYEMILSEWIATLTSRASGRSRVRLQRLIKQVAVQLFLASNGVRIVQKRHTVDDDTEDAPPSDTEFILPVRKKRSATNLSAYYGSTPIQSSPIDETSKASSHGHDHAAETSKPSISGRSSNRIYCPSKNLQDYVVVASQEKLTDSMSKVTNQWAIGDDPNSIDWLVAIDDKHHQELQRASELAKVRLEKRAHKRQQLSQSHFAPKSSQVMQVQALSQPVSSSQIIAPPVIQSSQGHRKGLNSSPHRSLPRRFGSSQLSGKSKTVHVPGF